MGVTIENVAHQPDPLLGGIWAMISTVVVLQGIHEETIKAGYHRIAGSFLGAVISVVICTVFGYGIMQIIGSIFLSICAIKCINISSTIRITAATAGIISAHGLNAHHIIPWHDGSIRFITAVLGALLAIAGSYFLAWCEKHIPLFRN